MRLSKHALVIPVAGLMLVAGMTGCASKKKAAATASPSPKNVIVKDDALAALVPAKIRAAGKISAATDASYAPDEFYASDNKTIVGMDVHLGKAIGQVLGLDMTFTNTGFDGILASLGSRYDIGMSSFTDNKKREKVVDMVTYYSAGTGFAVKSDSTLNIATLADLCGHSAAAEKGTTQYDDLVAQAKKCTTGKLTAVAFPDQNAATLAVISGRSDVVLGDAPTIAYAVTKSAGKLKIGGTQYGAAPYGIAVPKSTAYKGLADAIKGALEKLIANGDYAKILATWNLSAGAITTPVINGAIS